MIDNHQANIEENASGLNVASIQEFDLAAFGKNIFNFFSTPEIQKIANPIMPYIEELAVYIPLIESAGIRLENIYTDITPTAPLLILEFKLEAVDERKLDSIVSESIEAKQKISSGLQLLRSAVQASKSKIGQFGIDKIQIRMGPYPPFASTRLQYSRSQ
jgi:hypothetical protein